MRRIRFYRLYVEDDGDYGQVDIPTGDWIVNVELHPAPADYAIIVPRVVWVAHVESETPVTFDEWLTMGHEAGWCSRPMCSTHDMLPMTEGEEAEFDDGGDPCIPAVRLYEPGTN